METKTLKFYKLGHQFLNSSKVLLEKLVENDNRQVVISNFEITEEYYNEQTKYSDFNIIIPILFNYYHGLELIIKAALEQVGKLKKDRHNMEDLIKRLKEEYKEDENFINCIIEKIDKPIQIVNKFQTDNNRINGFSVYEALRYPDNKSADKLIKYESLLYNGDIIIDDCREIIQNIENIKIVTVRKYRELEEK